MPLFTRFWCLCIFLSPLAQLCLGWYRKRILHILRLCPLWGPSRREESRLTGGAWDKSVSLYFKYKGCQGTSQRISEAPAASSKAEGMVGHTGSPREPLSCQGNRSVGPHRHPSCLTISNSSAAGKILCLAYQIGSVALELGRQSRGC